MDPTVVKREDPECIIFGPFEVRPSGRLLSRGGIRVRLSGQPFRILLLFLKHPGEVVTREHLRNEIWGEGTFVDFEHSLNAAMNKLRRTLGDSADHPKYVETLAGSGYRFIGSIEQPCSPRREATAELLPELIAIGNGSAGKETLTPKPRALTRLLVVLATTLTSVVTLVATYLYFHRDPRLTNQDTIVLADLLNATGDPVFDGTLKQGLAIQLAQSPFLSLVSEERIRQTLRLMGRPPGCACEPGNRTRDL